MSKLPDYLERLRKVFRSTLNAKTTFEKFPGTKLYRVEVISSNFNKVTYAECQGMIWRVVEKYLLPEEMFHILSIYAMGEKK